MTEPQHNTDNPSANNSIAEQNIERMLARAYQPEVPDDLFVQRVSQQLQAAAQQRINATDASSTLRRAHKRTWPSFAGRLIALSLVIVIFILVIVAAPRSAKYYRDGSHVWIDGKPYAPVKSVPDESGTRIAERTDSFAAPGDRFGERLPPISETGLTARPRRTSASGSEPLPIGSSVSTSSGERRRVALPDGSVLMINEHTTVSLEAERKIRLGSGEVYVEVSPRNPSKSDAENEPTFFVSTAQRQIKALGTKFAVRADDEETGVVVVQGKVQVDGVDRTVVAGEQLSFSGAVQEEAQISPAPRASHVLAWTKDLIAAAESPLVPVSQHAGGSLVAVDPDGQETKLSLRKYHIDVHIEDGFARTTIDQTYFNHTPFRLEGTFYFPLPPDASISRLAMYVGGKLMEGGMCERDYARQVFETIKYRSLDPALLEWIDGSTFKMRVFPLEGREEKRIVLSYTQRLEPLYGRTEYRFPAGHNLPSVRDWSTRIVIKNGQDLQWRCDSHDLKPQVGTGEAVFTAEAHDIEPNRDIVLRLENRHADSAIKSPQPRISTTVHEGSRYVMLRWRPQFEVRAKRERRDWIFLFESSADRDPLMARVGIDVIRTILQNAEHDDTFAIVTAGTRSTPLTTEPLLNTPANAAAAISQLEKTHLIGALDVENALNAVKPLAEKADSPVLVHVGSGVPVLGERRNDLLLNKLPNGTTYVGVGIGKRWNRQIMKQAASRTGGYFTQINPDEDVIWRAFELLATLNTPRLQDVRINTSDLLHDSAPPLTGFNFLPFADQVADGEELCAVARVDDDSPLPSSLVVTGTLDGQPYKKELVVSEPSKDADYLPRMWAKLEIDRLLADDAEKNRESIVALSKSMYVMSPFTSLLVLENDAMYEQYKVDRGRKDHWALYPCPEQIPVVREPLADIVQSPPTADDQDELDRPSAEEVLRTILVRVPHQFSENGQANSKHGRTYTAWHLCFSPHPLADPQWSITGTGEVLDKLASEAELRVKEMPLKEVLQQIERKHGLRIQVDRQALRERGLLFDEPVTRDLSGITLRSVLGLLLKQYGLVYVADEEQIHVTNPERLNFVMPFAEPVSVPDGGVILLGGIRIEPRARFDQWRLLVGASDFEFDELIDLIQSTNAPETWNAVGGPGAIQGFEGNLSLIISQTQEVHEGFRVGIPDFRFTPITTTVLVPDVGTVLIGGVRRRLDLFDANSANLSSRWDDDGYLEYFEYDFADFNNMYLASLASTRRRSSTEINVLIDNSMSMAIHRRDTNGDYLWPPRVVLFNGQSPYVVGVYDAPTSMALLPFLGTGQPAFFDGQTTFGRTWDVDSDGDGLADSMWIDLPGDDSVTRALRWIHQHQPAVAGWSFTSPTRRGVETSTYSTNRIKGDFTRGLLYQRPELGLKPEAFTDLVAYAPGMNTNWTDMLGALADEAQADVPRRKGQVDAGSRKLIERARSGGWQRVALERKTPENSSTIDVDGAGRFRLERKTEHGLFEQVICDGRTLRYFYPELGVAAERQVNHLHRMLVTQWLPWLLPPVDDLAHGADVRQIGPLTIAIAPRGADEAKDAEGKPLKYVRLHLVFSKEGRLVERQLVEMPSGTILRRLVMDGNGSVRRLDAEGKELAARKFDVASCDAPKLQQADLSQFVVLPLPFRTLSDELAKLPKAEYAKLNDADAAKLLAYQVALRSRDMQDLIERRFFERGDHRLGFYTLLLSSKYSRWLAHLSPSATAEDLVPPQLNPLPKHDDAPLAHYFVNLHQWPSGGPHDPPLIPGARDGFLQQLAKLRRIHERFSSGRVKWLVADESDTSRDPFADNGYARPSADKVLLDAELESVVDFAGGCESPTLAWTALGLVHSGYLEKTARRTLADAYGQLARHASLNYAARFERARLLASADTFNDDHDARLKQAADEFTRLYRETLDVGRLPPIDQKFVDTLDETGRMPSFLDETSRSLIEAGQRPALVSLAWQLHMCNRPGPSDETLNRALADVPRDEILPTTLSAIALLWQTDRRERANVLLEQLLHDDEFSRRTDLWRMGVMMSHAEGKLGQTLQRLETLFDLSYASQSGEVNIEHVRRDYGLLLAGYEDLADSVASLGDAASAELTARIVRNADRWRSLDVDPTPACNAAARVLRGVGARDLAWDYLSSPLADRPYESEPWVNLAQTLREEGESQLAERAYATAFEAERTNAQFLWDRAQLLEQMGHKDEARHVYKQIADSEWQPRFQSIQSRAKLLIDDDN